MTANRSFGGHWELQWERFHPRAGRSRVTASSGASQRGVEEKRRLLDRAGKETDGSNLRRRQVQGKVYTRRGEPCTCCQLRERSQGRRWEAQERGEMMKEGSGAGGTKRTADAEGSSEKRRRDASSGGKERAVKTRQGCRWSAVEGRAGSPLWPALCVFCSMPMQPRGGTASNRLYCITEQERGGSVA